MNKAKKPLTGRRRSVRNWAFWVREVARRRLICCIRRHESLFGANGGKLHFQSPTRGQTRTVHVCKRCGAIYSKPKAGEDPARGFRMRDIF